MECGVENINQFLVERLALYRFFCLFFFSLKLMILSFVFAAQLLGTLYTLQVNEKMLHGGEKNHSSILKYLCIFFTFLEDFSLLQFT